MKEAPYKVSAYHLYPIAQAPTGRRAFFWAQFWNHKKRWRNFGNFSKCGPKTNLGWPPLSQTKPWFKVPWFRPTLQFVHAPKLHSNGPGIKNQNVFLAWSNFHKTRRLHLMRSYLNMCSFYGYFMEKKLWKWNFNFFGVPSFSWVSIRWKSAGKF